MVLRGRDRRKVALRIVLVTAVTIAAVLLLLRYVDGATLLRMLVTLNPVWALAGAVTFLFGHLLRYWRYSLVWAWPRSPAFLGTTAIHGFASYVLPLRLGELVLPLMIRRQGVTSFPQALGGLVAVRVYDAFMVLVFGALLLLVEPTVVSLILPESAAAVPVPWLAMLILLPSVAFLWLITGRLRQGEGGVSRVRFALLSLMIWLSVFGTNLAVMRALGMDVQPVVLVLLIVLGVFATVTPLQGLAGLGGHQLVWVLSLAAGGMSTDAALQVSVASHILIILYVCLLGMVGFGVAWLAGRRCPLPA